jgi:23S rRNA (pseudouridine1915-N3)-methyltransferase
MIRIKLLSVGKTHEPWLQEGMQMYVERLSPWAQFEFVWLKDLAHLEKEVEKEKHVVILDATGHMCDSIAFSEWVFKEIEKGGSRLSFVIGPADGLPEAMKKRYPAVSLSRLTFTHQLARLLLMEQLFRAFEIKKGSAYHK